MRTARGSRLPTGSRGRSFVGDWLGSRCVAGTRWPSSHAARTTGGSETAGCAGSGDKVLVEMTPYDLTKGRITYRFK